MYFSKDKVQLFIYSNYIGRIFHLYTQISIDSTHSHLLTIRELVACWLFQRDTPLLNCLVPEQCVVILLYEGTISSSFRIPVIELLSRLPRHSKEAHHFVYSHPYFLCLCSSVIFCSRLVGSFLYDSFFSSYLLHILRACLATQGMSCYTC